MSVWSHSGAQYQHDVWGTDDCDLLTLSREGVQVGFTVGLQHAL